MPRGICIYEPDDESKYQNQFFRLFWQMIEKKLQIKVNSLDDFEVAIGNTILALANFFS